MRLFSFILSVLFLTGCNLREEEPRCPPRPNPDRIIPPDLVSYFDFKIGSYWVFKNEINGRQDTLSVAMNPTFGYTAEPYDIKMKDGSTKVLNCDLWGSKGFRFKRQNIDTLSCSVFTVTGGCAGRFYVLTKPYNPLEYTFILNCNNGTIDNLIKDSTNKHEYLEYRSIKDTLDNKQVMFISEAFNYKDLYIGQQTGFLKFSINDTAFTLIKSNLIR